MKIETERLTLLPLSDDQLVLYFQPNHKFEEEFNLKQNDRLIPEDLLEALNQTLIPNLKDKSRNYLYNTLWTIIDKKQNEVVADFCFKGDPNDMGEIEIGYGTYEAFKGKGYMTEAIKAVTEWALDDPNVTTILAETKMTNLASHRVLQKNNFKEYKQDRNMIWWKCGKNK